MHPTDALVFGPMILQLAFWPAIFFWTLVAVIFIELCFDQGFVAFGTLVLATLASYWLGYWTLDFVYQHQTAFLWLLAFYVPIGVVWSTIKWWFYTTGVARKVEQYLNKRATDARKAASSDADFEERMRRIRDALPFEELPPLVSNHKSDLTRWMAWWPFSIIGSIFDDMLRRFFTAIYNAMGRIWQRISNHAFRNVQFKNPPIPDPADKTAAE